MRGGQLMAEQLDTDALVTIRGAAPAVDRRSRTDADALAEIRARGMTVARGRREARRRPEPACGSTGRASPTWC